MNELRLPRMRETLEWRDMLWVALFVSALHGLVLACWFAHPRAQAIASDGSFEVSLAAPLATEVSRPVARLPLRVVDQEADKVVPEAVPETAPAPSVVADSEPDYRASYLNNPPPSYPLFARRRGLQGKVLLNVEVLAEGRCGAVNVQQSSGYEVLDQSAIETVKGWHFAPASHLGQAVTRWFLVPIQFKLQDDAA